MFALGDRVTTRAKYDDPPVGTVVAVTRTRSTNLLAKWCYRVIWDGPGDEPDGGDTMFDHELRYLDSPPADRSPESIERWLVS